MITYPVSFCLIISFLPPDCLPWHCVSDCSVEKPKINVVSIPSCRLQPLIYPVGRIDLWQSASIKSDQYCALKFLQISPAPLPPPGILVCECKSNSAIVLQLQEHTFIDCNSFNPFCINSCICLSSCTSLCSRNESLVFRFAYSLKL